MKLYIARRDFTDAGDLLCWFSQSPESAATWEFRHVAEVHLRDFNHKGVTVPSSAGGTHTIRNFAIEERPDGKLVLACDAPLLV